MQQKLSPLLNESSSLVFEIESLGKKSPLPASPIFYVQARTVSRDRIDSDEFSEVILNRKTQIYQKRNKNLFVKNSKTAKKDKRLARKSKQLTKFPSLEVS